jgi:hypothetical protein
MYLHINPFIRHEYVKPGFLWTQNLKILYYVIKKYYKYITSYKLFQFTIIFFTNYEKSHYK